jgi:hypothetical protein
VPLLRYPKEERENRKESERKKEEGRKIGEKIKE